MKTTEKLFKNPNSRFLEVECKNCLSKQIIFNKATTKVKCNTCGKILVIPTGGKSEILTKIVRVGDENNDLHSLLPMQNSESKPAQPKLDTPNASSFTFYKKPKTDIPAKKFTTKSSVQSLTKKELKSKNAQKQ